MDRPYLPSLRTSNGPSIMSHLRHDGHLKPYFLIVNPILAFWTTFFRTFYAFFRTKYF